jgi:hypothetical protein
MDSKIERLADLNDTAQMNARQFRLALQDVQNPSDLAFAADLSRRADRVAAQTKADLDKARWVARRKAA